MGASISTATRKSRDAALWKRKRKTCWRRPRRPPRRTRTQRARKRARKSPKKRSPKRKSRKRSPNRRKWKVNREERNENHANRCARRSCGNGLWSGGGDELRADGRIDGRCRHPRQEFH